MNKFGNLHWEFSSLQFSTTFLDLNITISSTSPSSTLYDPPPTNTTISFSTFQKPMNLYLYLPPHSTHPPGITCSLIYSLIRKYWIQNSLKEDFTSIIKSLFQRLIVRGHHSKRLYKLFIATANTLDSKPINPSSLQQLNHNNTPLTPHPNTIFLKWKYHPPYLPKRNLRQIYTSTCETPSPHSANGFQHLPTDNGAVLKINKLTIAYSRDRNIRDILIPSRLSTLPLYKATYFIPPPTIDTNDTTF